MLRGLHRVVTGGDTPPQGPDCGLGHRGSRPPIACSTAAQI